MKNARFIGFVLGLGMLMPLGGCRQQQAPASGLPVVEMKIGTKDYRLEVARDDYSREHGLMERDSMAAERGMIFVFDADTNEPFWMKNTRIPLDILFIDVSGKIISVKQMKPYDETNTLPDGYYRYAVELNAGAAADDGAKAGDRVNLPAIPR